MYLRGVSSRLVPFVLPFFHSFFFFILYFFVVVVFFPFFHLFVPLFCNL